MGCRDDLWHRIARSGVHVADLCAHDGGVGVSAERVGERVRSHGSLCVDCHPLDAARSETDHLQRLQYRGMDLVAHQHANTGCLREPIGLDVPTSPR